MAKLKIKTDTQIKALKKSGGYLNDDRFSVDSVRNLYLFYYAKTERKVFYFRYAHPITKLRLNLLMGEYPSLSLSQAVRLAVGSRLCIDPKAELFCLMGLLSIAATQPFANSPHFFPPCIPSALRADAVHG